MEGGGGGEGGTRTREGRDADGFTARPLCRSDALPLKPTHGGGRAAGEDVWTRDVREREAQNVEAPSGWSAGGGLVERATGEVVYVPESSGEPENRLDQLR